MKKNFALTIAILGTIGVILTIIGASLDNVDDSFFSIFNTLKYFTVQSNIIVSLYFFLVWKFKDNIFLNKSLGAVVVYITITFLVFATVLQPIWHPQGISFIGSLLSHYIVPVSSISFLVIYRNDYHFRYKDILFWIIYPLIYLVFLLIHGIITSDYIYPFFDIQSLGLLLFFVYLLCIVILFVLISSIYIYVTKKNKTQSN